jgi:hypothetical protein
MAQTPKTPTQRQIAEEINEKVAKLLPKSVKKRLESIPPFGAYKLPVVVNKSKLQPSSTTETWRIKLYKPISPEEFERMKEEFNKRFSKFGFYYLESDVKNGLIEYVGGGTPMPLEPSEIFALHRYMHDKLGYLTAKGDCTICPVNPEDADEIAVYTVVVGLPDNMSACPVQCRYCYARPATPDSTLARTIESMRDLIFKRLKLIVENIVTDAKAGNSGVPFVNIILWGGNSDPTLLSNDYYTAIIEQFVNWVYENKKRDRQWYLAFAFNMSTSAFDVDEIIRLYRILDNMREKIFNSVSRDDWDLLSYHHSLMAVTAYRPDLYHLSSAEDDSAFRYMYRIFRLPSPKITDDVNYNVLVAPTFIIDSVLDEFVDYIVATTYWTSYVPLILSPYGTQTELYRYFKLRNVGQVGNIATKLLWRLLHIYDKVKIETCTYNAVFHGIQTPQIYEGKFIRVYVDPLNNKVSHAIHDGTWCPRGIYSGRGCIYPPRPPPTTT